MSLRYFSTADKAACCGCTACEQVCQVAAIHMEKDTEGFLYPVLDRQKCVECSRCNAVCPMENSALRDGAIEAFAAIHADENVLRASSSGGVFTAIAESVLDTDGCVFGAILENNRVVHRMAETKDELAAMRGSKYVQSELGNTLRHVQECLRAGRVVLFTGTPCQCAAARRIVGNAQEKLLTVDVVCHGVPSPAVFADYIQWLSEVHRSPIQFFGFRAKQTNRMGVTETYQTRNGVKMHPAYDSRYLTGFLRGFFFRPSCYECPYATMLRSSDMTICDFWGCERYHPQLDTLKGISGVIVNTPKGKEWLERASGALQLNPTTVEKIAAGNANLQHPTPKPPERDRFYEDRLQMNFAELSKRYLLDDDAWKKRLIAKVPKQIKMILKGIGR